MTKPPDAGRSDSRLMRWSLPVLVVMLLGLFAVGVLVWFGVIDLADL